jgi:hypothetical protein
MRPNTPDEVSLLIGIALTEAGFHERVKTSDWLNRFGEPETAEAYWRDIYLPLIVEPMQELVAKANKLKVQVTDGTLSEVACATNHSSVVIVMAHWRDSHVEFDDLAAGLSREAWRERSLRHSSPLARWLTTRLEEKPSSPLIRWLPALGKKRLDPVDQILRKALIVELPEEAAGPQPALIRESPMTRAARRRAEIDSIFDGMIRPGNRLELLDGLHSKEVFEAAIAPDFDGVIDFAACTSTILADYVAHRRRNRLRLVQAPNPIEFVGTAPIVAGTLELLAGGLFSYQEARTNARALWEGAACAT